MTTTERTETVTSTYRAAGGQGWWWPIALFSAAVSLIFIALVFARLKGVFLGVLFRDPIAVGEMPMYTGIFSHLGVILWCGAASVCLFSAMLLLRGGVREQGLFLLWSGVLTALLLIDDLFMIHDRLFEDVLEITEFVPIAAYGLLLLWILWRFRRTILASQWHLFAAALVLFFLSVAEDALEIVQGDAHYLFEDGFKFLGIVAWFGYFVRHGLMTCRRSLVPAGRAAATVTTASRATAPAAPAGRRFGWTKAAVASVLVVVMLLAGAEIFARHKLGLGDPPLWMADSEIEYLVLPGRTYRRFGNVISFNSWSMRSEEFPATKADPQEVRVMVLGNHIINGGTLTDQQDTATEVLRHRLEEVLQRPVVVGNISAESWGPPNLLAYIERHGLLDADVVFIVLGSEDYANVPKFQPLVGVDPRFPDQPPVLALHEVWQRYISSLFRISVRSPFAELPSEEGEAAKVEKAMGALRKLIDTAREAGAEVFIVQHLAKVELYADEGPWPGYWAIQSLAEETQTPVIDLWEVFAEADTGGRSPYRDSINPNEEGQRLMARMMEAAVLRTVLGQPEP